MCGIFGFLKAGIFDPAASTSDLESGMDIIRHRGPDGTGTWISDNGQVGLGHVRLSIIDLETGAQPMQSADGRFTITYNGEIYNYIDLRAEIGEKEFRTTSDTEVILRAFERWGQDCVDRLRGMFAFAIWDVHEQKLFLARDRFGIKPLYWTNTSSGVYFASEVKALRPFLEQRQVSPTALSDYFTIQFCLGEKTMLDNLWQLPAAHTSTISPGEAPQTRRYWEVHYTVDYDHTEKWFIERLKDLVYDSVRIHLRADVEGGSYVSGGVDSSLMAALARDIRPDGPFKAFNGRFLDGPGFDESHYASALTDQWDMQLHISDIGEQDFVDHISKVIWHLDQPTAGPGSFPQYMESREVGEKTRLDNVHINNTDTKYFVVTDRNCQ